MRISLIHPSLDQITDFAHDSLSPQEKERTATHLRKCVQCQRDLRFAHGLMAKRDSLETSTASEELLQRALASRAAGVRLIYPVPDTSHGDMAPRRQSKRGWVTTRLAVAASVLVLAAIAVVKSNELAATESDSSLQILPSHPQTGDTLHVRYARSAYTKFQEAKHLVLRGGLRAPSNEMYSSGVPVRTLAVLTRQNDGAFTGQFVLPDSVVYVSLAIEDSAASNIDRGGVHIWEVMIHDNNAQPKLDALMQRVNDMMGRSWEEGYATAKEMTTRYPQRPLSWNMLQFFEQSLYEGRTLDSVTKISSARMAEILPAAKAMKSMSEAEMSGIHFQKWAKSWDGTSAADSAELSYWWNRLLREYPNGEQVSQRVAIDMDRAHVAPQFMLDSLERIYARLIAANGKIQSNYFQKAMYAAQTLKNDSLLALWGSRSLRGSPDSMRSETMAMVKRPQSRAAAINALRTLLGNSASEQFRPRALSENAEQYARAKVDRHQNLMAVLGRALIAEGSTKAGLDTLAKAAESGWNIGLLRELQRGFVDANDMHSAAVVSAKLVVDPRTSKAQRDSLTVSARAALDEQTWSENIKAARDTMIARTMLTSYTKVIPGAPRILSASGEKRGLRESADSVPMVVIFWSAHCGPALQAAPNIQKAANSLQQNGIPVVLLTEESNVAETEQIATEKGLTLPVYRDTDGSMSKAFSNFGTPTYYVLDRKGRIRFATSSVELLTLQVEALRITH
ncbi:MAG: TlpA disulfide reductase family protein [Gemmatimonadaceae bacterium]